MKINPAKTRIFRENEDLPAFIFKYIKKLPEKSVVVVTSKIVSLSEGRVAEYKNERNFIKLVKAESSFALKTLYTWLTIKDSMVMANAGMDKSNGSGKLILLPKDSFNSAVLIRRALQKKFKVKNLGVLITDSRLFPLRAGVVGAALGYAGFEGIRNYTGKPDIFGRKFKYQKTNVADSLAAAALSMGEGSEKQPLALITDAPIAFTEKINKQEMGIKPEEDIFYPLFKNINAKRKK